MPAMNQQRPVRAQSMVAAAFAIAGALVLTTKAVRSFPRHAFGIEPAAGVFVGIVAVVAIGAAITALRAPAIARVLAVAALVGALVGEWLPAAPPNLIALLPLSLAAGLLLVPRRDSVRLSQAAGEEAAEAHPVAAHPVRPHPRWAVAVGWLAVVLHGAVGFLYLLSGLVAPGYGVLFLWALWGALLVVVLRLRTRRPLWTPALPVVAAVLWQAVLLFGGAVLGWQA